MGWLTAELRERFDGNDVRRSEAEAAFGAPSIVADRPVLWYAQADSSGWIFID
jgi:hypothetical protein